MTIRNMVMVAGLAAVASGCVVAPGHYEERRYESSHRVVYHENDSYEGYYYARVVYISGVPWYVDEYRRARPIPRHLHAHFRNASWTRSLPPRFSQDTVVRDGYPLSRIVYINGTPHHIDDDRRARPVPTKLRSRFSYATVVHDDDRGRKLGERPESPVHVRERERDERPAYVRERERVEQPAYVRERERDEQPAYVRERERDERPAYVRERERDEQPAYVRGRERDEQPAYVRGREKPPAYIDERERRGPVSGSESMRRPEGVPERVREERGNGAPPFARNGRGAPGQMEEQPARGQAGGERRPMAQGRNEERGRIQPTSDARQGGQGAAWGNEQRTESAPGRQKEKAKGRGRDRDEEEEEDEPGKKPRGR